MEKLKKIMKNRIVLFIILVVLALLIAFFSTRKSKEAGIIVTSKTQSCIDCHREKNIHDVQIIEWEKSLHAAKGVGCFECHQANKEDSDAWKHMGFVLSKIVSPKDCAQCHKKEFEEFDASHHAKAGEILGSLDNYLGEVVEGDGASIQGCQSCHGSIVKINEDGSFDAKTWPNIGIGRLNPDGSKGTCSACHSKHRFSLEVAREPATCGKCHIGPDHPQLEIYEESVHGKIFNVSKDKMNLDSHQWVLGKDYSQAPTCITCHMGQTKEVNRTHDIGERLSWNLRAPISKPMKDSKKKREAMQKVCLNCHGPEWVTNFYAQLDGSVALYNNFAKEAQTIMEMLKEEGKLSKTSFDEEIEWIYFELWHHEGRRLRHGAAMMGPDYVQWHGFYEYAKHFYFKFLPIVAKKYHKEAYVENLLNKPEHAWIKGKIPENFEIQQNEFENWYLERKKFEKEQK